MLKKISKRLVTFILAVLMVVAVAPMQVFAAGSVTTYEDFMTKFKQLEVYADEYAKASLRDAGELVLNFVRTGVERYLDEEWTKLAGAEIVGFTSYVETRDTEMGTSVMDLRDIVTKDFKLPNGNKVDFGHMFGCMNISYYAPKSADLSGWAGDLCDLLRYCKELGTITGSVEDMAAYIRKNCLGVDASEAFGWDDFWGDMDAYYLISEYRNANGEKKFSEIMESYYKTPETTQLDDTVRTVYFMNNRFGVEDSKAAVRKAIYEAYSADVGIKLLEAKRGLSSYNALREACCYAVADYIYEKAQGKLVERNEDETEGNGYYSVFSDTVTTLAPGITQNIKYAQTVDGKQIVYYVATVDVTRKDVMIMANYRDNDPSKGWGLQTVMDQTNALVENYKNKKDENGQPLYEYFTPVVATNGDGYNIYNGTPGGLLVMDGKEWYGVDHDGFFAILDDGSAVIGTKAEYDTYKSRIKEAIGGFGAVLVKDGVINVTANPNYTAARASRTAVGITGDGKVVMMVMDGRQQPFSAGGSMEEIAQVMLEAGCVHAINLDGGGSTTYLSKPAGSDNIQLINRPSDGYQRLVAVSLVAVSTAEPSTKLSEAVISSQYEYITVGTSMPMNVIGVSNTGNAAVIPDGSYWSVSDETVGTIDKDKGVFTARANGEVTVQFIVDGEVVGTKKINVVTPDDITFVEDRITAIYGQPKEIEVTVWYQGSPVAFTPMRDAFVFFDYSFDENGQPQLKLTSDAGVINGFTFTGKQDKGVRVTNVMAGLRIGNDFKGAMATVNLYHKDEATFDFDNATLGNRNLAWLREIENARSTDNQLYRITDPTKPVEIKYTFALDMTAIAMPEQLEGLKGMLENYTNPNATAWDMLLGFAERICVQTNVTIRAEFSPELDVDISGLKVITDYFEITRANLDENNVLTVVCNWKDQTQSIDPATANPLCILAGITATVKDTASYFNNEVVITNNGTVSYDIYLATTALHSFASDPANQAQFGLYPFEHSDEKYPNGCRKDDHDHGGHFSSQYLDFADSYVVDLEIRQGWQEEDGEYYFYKDNVALTGTQLVTDRHDSTKLRFYEFDENGKLVDERGVTGLIELGEDLFYATLGVAQTGWREFGGNNYYFLPGSGKAADGIVTLRENANSMQTNDYTYTFVDHILVRGALVSEYDAVAKRSGYRYRWAGQWLNGWYEVDGKAYWAEKHHPFFVATGYASVPLRESSVYRYHLFDDKGALQEDYTNVWHVGDNSYFLQNGVYCNVGGLAQADDGHIYLINGSNGTIEKNVTTFVNDTKAHTYVDAGTYTFDEFGRLKNPLVSEEIIKNETKTEVVTEIIGRVLSVKAAVTCKVAYLKDGKYHVIEAKVNPYAVSTFATEAESEYIFAIPKGATEVKIIMAGDLDGNGKIEADDVTKLQQFILGKSEALTKEQEIACDVNGDGKFTAVDLALINAARLGKKKLDW